MHCAYNYSPSGIIIRSIICERSDQMDRICANMAAKDTNQGWSLTTHAPGQINNQDYLLLRYVQEKR